MIKVNDQVQESFKKLYKEKRETIEYACKFGNPTERANASLIKDIATTC